MKELCVTFCGDWISTFDLITTFHVIFIFQWIEESQQKMRSTKKYNLNYATEIDNV